MKQVQLTLFKRHPELSEEPAWLPGAMGCSAGYRGMSTWKTDCDWICRERRGGGMKNISQGTVAHRDPG